MGLLGRCRRSALNQKDGFDCPSCAWPDLTGRSRRVLRERREARRQATRAATENSSARIAFPADEESDLWLGQQGRLTRPMVLREGREHYEPISWEAAFSLIAEELAALSSPNEAVFYTSGRTSNEAAFLFQLFARQFGTNNLPDCSNMCHESSGSALTPVIGIGKGTVTLADFTKAQAIFVVGQNPGTNHPRMLTALQEAKRAGATIVSVNPLPETGLLRFKHPQEVFDTLFGKGTKLADLFLQVRIGGDMAVLKGIMKEMLAAEAAAPGTVLDRRFLDAKTSGWSRFVAALEEVAWEDIVRESGVSRGQIREAAAIASASPSTIVCWAMGLTQHPHAVGTIQEIVNFLLLRGSIGRPGRRSPVRGQQRQGDRTMGIWSARRAVPRRPRCARLRARSWYDTSPR